MTAGGLSARGLTIVRPDGKAILRGAALDIGPSEVVLLAGPSGCGKSTLLSLLGGILDADGGGWTVAGTLLRDGEETDLAAGPAQAGGVVFQSHALFDELDARSNLRIARDHAPGGSVAAERDILPMLADIDPRQSVGASSGGQRQRLAIARTVLADHPVLLLDEPNAGLDIVSSRRLVELIRGLCRTMGKPALIAVHHASELLPLADRVLVMDPTTAELAEVAPDAAALEARLARAAGAEALAADAAAPAADAARWRLGGGWAPRRSHGAWMAHYAATYLWLLCASPIMLVYVGAGAAITGFVTIWYGFNYYSFGGLLRSALHDETLVGLGTVQSRVALPMIVTILFVARNSAVVAADIGNRALTRQFAAMDNLGIPGRLYIYGGIALAMVAGAVLSLVLALLLGAWAAQETWLFQFPTQHRELFRGLYFRNVLTDAGWPVAAMGWAVAKVAISAALAAAASIAIASGPKESSQAVSRAVADAIVAGTLIALGVHAAISALTAVR